MSLLSLANTVLPFFISLVKKLDENCLAPLKPHQHKVVCFDIEGIVTLHFLIEAQGLTLVEKPQHVDATFTGPLSSFMTTLLKKQRTQTGMHIKGDMDVAKAFYDCISYLDIDWENHLAKTFGDNLAHTLVNGFTKTKAWAKETLSARCDDLGAYLQDEKELAPSKAEVEAFYQEVDKLKHDVERLEATLHHLNLKEHK